MAGTRGKFVRGRNPMRTLDLGISNRVFQSCGKPYQEGGGYSFNYYGAENWMDVIKWLLDHGYTAEETEEVMRSKLMRWASDKAGHSDEDCTLEDFLEFNNEPTRGGKTQVDDFLDEYFPDPSRKDRIINENVAAPMATLVNTPGMGNAVPPQQAATTGNQFYQPATKGSGDLWGGKGKQRKKRKGRKIKLVKESLNEENISPYDKLGMAMAKKMGIKPPFKKKKDKKNQNSMSQQV
jgi:hypothetical protein